MGIRHIEELVVDPLFNLDDADEANNAEVETAANQAQQASPYLLDGSAAPMGYEKAQEDELNIQVYLEREYLWGPGDRGVDELLVQFDHTVNRTPWWVIQDDGGWHRDRLGSFHRDRLCDLNEYVALCNGSHVASPRRPQLRIARWRVACYFIFAMAHPSSDA
ncbi:MAG: hypothetical protein KF678_08760 [Phycisphaeraceae bacterium]|nr:hypothetical protein [Phycisphaeraceae bacterium]